MFNQTIHASIRYRYFVLAFSLAVLCVGVLVGRRLVIDAVPDITNVQVQINTEVPGYSPFEVEQRVTLPLELMLAGMPGLDYTRSLSRYGLSQVTVVFSDETDVYFARRLVSERLSEGRQALPEGASPTLGPISTGLGEIFMFILENAPDAAIKRPLSELREIQDWVVRPQLRTVPGVVEINSIGGAPKQITVLPDLERLRSYELSLSDLSRAIRENNANIGAGFIEEGGEQLLLRVPAQAEKMSDLSEIVVATRGGVPVLIKDVASVEIGSELRVGAATADGEEVVLGTVFMLKGENGRAVAERVRKRLGEIGATLPAGVVVQAMYDRSILVNATIKTVFRNLVEGALLVVLVLSLALGNLRAALITACVIPLAMVMTVFGMVQSHLSANLMSLGALDFGLIVDGAVILVENCIRRLGDERVRLGRAPSHAERLKLVYEASTEVRQATMFGELIIMIVYVPILALSGIEGKMYHPMALTVLLALGAAFILSLTFVPAAVAIFVEVKGEEQGRWLLALQSGYRWVLNSIMRIPRVVAMSAVLLFASSLMVCSRLGSEFIPSLDEGDIALHALRIPGTSLSQAIGMQHQLEEVVAAVPEVSHVFAKIGTAEIATDPMPPSVADGYVMLKPRAQWPDPEKSKSAIVADIEARALEVPGNNYEFTQPIQMRFNELIAGVRSDVAVKVFGDDTDVLRQQGEQIEAILSSIPGASDTKQEQMTGLPMIVVKPDRQQLARFGLTTAAVQEVIRTAYAGDEVSRFYEGDRNFPIVVRLRDEDRSQREQIGRLILPLPSAEADPQPSSDTIGERANLVIHAEGSRYLTVADVASIELAEGPNQISRENGKRRVVVTTNVRGRDLGSFVEEAQRRIAAELELPPQYWIGWGGQYEHLISARRRLFVVVPFVLLSIFFLIYATFQSVRNALFVFSGVPFALTGGLFALWLRDIPFSISAAIGCIALSGVSVLNGLVLMSFIAKLLQRGVETKEAIIEGSVSRLRPVLMTALVASLGFVPMALSQGTGSEVQRPLATVVIGGIVSSTVLTLVVLPALVSLFARREG